MKAKLDAEEQELLDSVERGEWRPLVNIEEEKKRFVGAARATLRKDRRVSLRISNFDLQALQVRALAEGLPYQTLIASVLHKYASGRLREC